MRYLLTGVIFTFSLLNAGIAQTEIRLPSMGEASSGIISLEQERALGQSWLRSYRAQSDIGRDYILQEYIEDLVSRMAQYSQLQDKRLDILLIKDPALNAFAVPGGIVGVNTGLFVHAQNEAQFASVMAHELSHLSQRHFARSVAEQQSSQFATMAGLLAGILLAATAGGDAGMAMISATQAAALESGLRYSRQHEQEADRIGIEVLAKAGYDPRAMGNMFENMLKTTRYVGYQAPEYLRTHPLTESRVNDATNRARQYPQRYYSPSLTYQLMRARVEVQQSGSPDQAVRKFEARLDEENTEVNRYALALAYKQALKFAQSREISADLHREFPENQIFAMLYAEVLGLFGESQEAENLIREHLKQRPNSYSLNMALASALSQGGKFTEAATILREQTLARPNDSAVWYEYAETLGLAGNLLELHKARAEYFMLVGAYDRAIRQLQQAKTEAAGDSIELAILDEKISRAARLRSSGSEFQ